MAESEKMDYKEWKFNVKSSISKIRKEYIKYISKQYIN